ncbi:MAG TPA: hypothetical protein VGH38_24355 [Bryobacteraceae bacterium]
MSHAGAAIADWQEEEIMTAIDGSANDARQPWGVLGTGTPTDFPMQDAPPTVVPAVGVQGVAADSPDSISAFTQGFGDEPIVQPGAGAGVLGVRLNDGAQVESFGFLGGRSPFAAETTGAFGQAAERGVIGIATTADGIGVYGGSVGGIARGIVGETETAIGVHGRAGAWSGVGVRGENTHGGMAGQFIGKVEILGDMTVGGVLHSADLEQKLNQVTTWCMRGNFRAHRTFEFGFSADDAPKGAITSDSIVLASVTEIDSNGVPRIGPTSVTIKLYNVVPGNNFVAVRGEVDSGEDVHFRISILIANPAEL